MNLTKEQLFDKRLIDRHIRLGYITRKEVDEYLAKLEEGSGSKAHKGHETTSLIDLQDKKEVKWVFVPKT